MMSTPPPEDAEQRLLRLLALKRHEVPPPGFFDRLPARILVNLRAGSEIEDGPWWSRIWQSLTREPMVGLSYAALGVGTVLFGASVLQTAMDVQTAPSTGPLVGMVAPGSSDFVVAPPATLSSGMIYRVVEPSPVIWVQPTEFQPQSTPLTRVDALELMPASYVTPR